MADALEIAKLKAERTYNAAADTFDAEPLAFWDRYGQRSVERLGLGNGARVLDVCCGTGASALPAAQAIGPEGRVIAVDLAEELLQLGRAKATAGGLHCLEFRRGDMTALDLPDSQFDAVVCVFGIFFVPDMEGQVAELWRLVRPGGQLAVTTWGPGIFSPAYEICDAGVPNAEVVAEEGYQDLRTPDDFWTIARGSGLRWTTRFPRGASSASQRMSFTRWHRKDRPRPNAGLHWTAFGRRIGAVPLGVRDRDRVLMDVETDTKRSRLCHG